MKPACCSVLATTDTLVRRTPIISADEFLREQEIVAALQITAAQKPACQARLDGVSRVARGGLLRLHQDDLLVPEQRGPRRVICASSRSRWESSTEAAPAI